MGSAMLGYLVEEVSGQPFDEFSKQQIFDPLGMSNTSWKLAGLNPNDVAMPYEYSGTNHVAQGHYGFPDYPNGQLRSSTNDMARFLRAFIGDGELQGARILSATATAEMRKLQIPNLDNSIGLTWTYDQIGGQSILGHNGGETGANTFMFYRPGDGMGVIVFTNTSAENEDLQDDQDNAVTDIAAELIKQTPLVITAPTGMIDAVRPTISWTAVDGALSYNVFLNIDNGGGNVFTQREISSNLTSLAIPQDLEFGRYRVFVEANMPNNVLKKQDQGHTFVVNVRSQLVPIGATTATSPQFTWNRVPGATRYRIFINVPGGAITAEVTDPGSGTTASHTITSALQRELPVFFWIAIREIPQRVRLRAVV